MNEDQANKKKVRFKCKKVNFIAQLLNKMHTDPQFSRWFGFKLCYISRHLKNTSQQNLDTGNLRSDLL